MALKNAYLSRPQTEALAQLPGTLKLPLSLHATAMLTFWPL